VYQLPGRRDRIVRPPPKKVYDHWRDDRGAHIGDGCRVEQVGVAKQFGALSSRLGVRGVVTGRARGSNGNRLHVRFDRETKPVLIRPHLLRVVPVTTEIIIKQLGDLRPAGDDHD
jgi:hypothetical protein